MPLGLRDRDIDIASQLVAAIVCYGLVTVLTATTFFPRRQINLMNWPPAIRADYWDMEPRDFFKDMSIHIENAAKSNETVLTKKGWIVRLILGGELAQLSLLLWWLWLLHRGIVG